MSFLTLEKYLSTPRAGSGSGAPGKAASASGTKAEGASLLDAVLGSVAGSIFSGEGLSDLAAELNRLRRTAASQSTPEQQAQFTQQFEKLLAASHERLRKADEERADDFRKVLATLNDALLHLSSTSDRRDTTLKQLESSLKLASRSEDLRTLKQQLSEVIEYVNRESTQQTAQSTQTMEALGTRAQWAQKTAAKLKTSFGSKEEATARLKEGAKLSGSDKKQYAAMFALDAIPALCNRHGSEVGNSLIDDFGRSRVQALLPDSRIFRWSTESMVAIWESEAELQAQVAMVSDSAKDPFEHRAFVGTRVASFSIPFRTVVASVQGDPQDIVYSLDRFVRGV